MNVDLSSWLAVLDNSGAGRDAALFRQHEVLPEAGDP
jgi:hypothetical protein